MTIPAEAEVEYGEAYDASFSMNPLSNRGRHIRVIVGPEAHRAQKDREAKKILHYVNTFLENDILYYESCAKEKERLKNCEVVKKMLEAMLQTGYNIEFLLDQTMQRLCADVPFEGGQKGRRDLVDVDWKQRLVKRVNVSEYVISNPEHFLPERVREEKSKKVVQDAIIEAAVKAGGQEITKEDSF